MSQTRSFGVDERPSTRKSESGRTPATDERSGHVTDDRPSLKTDDRSGPVWVSSSRVFNDRPVSRISERQSLGQNQAELLKMGRLVQLESGQLVQLISAVKSARVSKKARDSTHEVDIDNLDEKSTIVNEKPAKKPQTKPQTAEKSPKTAEKSPKTAEKLPKPNEKSPKARQSSGYGQGSSQPLPPQQHPGSENQQQHRNPSQSQASTSSQNQAFTNLFAQQQNTPQKVVQVQIQSNTPQKTTVQGEQHTGSGSSQNQHLLQHQHSSPQLHPPGKGSPHKTPIMIYQIVPHKVQKDGPQSQSPVTSPTSPTSKAPRRKKEQTRSSMPASVVVATSTPGLPTNVSIVSGIIPPNEIPPNEIPPNAVVSNSMKGISSNPVIVNQDGVSPVIINQDGAPLVPIQQLGGNFHPTTSFKLFKNSDSATTPTTPLPTTPLPTTPSNSNHAARRSTGLSKRSWPLFWKESSELILPAYLFEGGARGLCEINYPSVNGGKIDLALGSQTSTNLQILLTAKRILYFRDDQGEQKLVLVKNLVNDKKCVLEKESLFVTNAEFLNPDAVAAINDIPSVTDKPAIENAHNPDATGKGDSPNTVGNDGSPNNSTIVQVERIDMSKNDSPNAMKDIICNEEGNQDELLKVKSNGSSSGKDSTDLRIDKITFNISSIAAGSFHYACFGTMSASDYGYYGGGYGGMGNQSLSHGSSQLYHPTIFLLYCLDTEWNNNRRYRVHSYNLITNTYSQLDIKMGVAPKQRTGASFFYHKNTLYFLGGSCQFLGDHATSTFIYTFDLKLREWSTIDILFGRMQPRSNFSIVVHKEKLILFGGTRFNSENGEMEETNDLSIFCLKSLSWHQVPKPIIDSGEKYSGNQNAETPFFWPPPMSHHQAFRFQKGMLVLHQKESYFLDLKIFEKHPRKGIAEYSSTTSNSIVHSIWKHLPRVCFGPNISVRNNYFNEVLNPSGYGGVPGSYATGYTNGYYGYATGYSTNGYGMPIDLINLYWNPTSNSVSCSQISPMFPGSFSSPNEIMGSKLSWYTLNLGTVKNVRKVADRKRAQNDPYSQRSSTLSDVNLINDPETADLYFAVENQNGNEPEPFGVHRYVLSKTAPKLLALLDESSTVSTTKILKLSIWTNEIDSALDMRIREMARQDVQYARSLEHNNLERNNKNHYATTNYLAISPSLLTSLTDPGNWRLLLEILYLRFESLRYLCDLDIANRLLVLSAKLELTKITDWCESVINHFCVSTDDHVILRDNFSQYLRIAEVYKLQKLLVGFIDHFLSKNPELFFVNQQQQQNQTNALNLNINMVQNQEDIQNINNTFVEGDFVEGGRGVAGIQDELVGSAVEVDTSTTNLGNNTNLGATTMGQHTIGATAGQNFLSQKSSPLDSYGESQLSPGGVEFTYNESSSENRSSEQHHRGMTPGSHNLSHGSNMHNLSSSHVVSSNRPSPGRPPGGSLGQSAPIGSLGRPPSAPLGRPPSGKTVDDPRLTSENAKEAEVCGVHTAVNVIPRQVSAPTGQPTSHSYVPGNKNSSGYNNAPNGGYNALFTRLPVSNTIFNGHGHVSVGHGHVSVGHASVGSEGYYPPHHSHYSHSSKEKSTSGSMTPGISSMTPHMGGSMMQVSMPGSSMQVPAGALPQNMTPGIPTRTPAAAGVPTGVATPRVVPSRVMLSIPQSEQLQALKVQQKLKTWSSWNFKLPQIGFSWPLGQNQQRQSGAGSSHVQQQLGANNS